MTRQDMIDATEHYLLRRMTPAEIAQVPVSRFTAQVHRAAIAWALDGGPRPVDLDRRRPSGPSRRGVGRRDHDVDGYLLAVIGGRERPPRRG